MLEPDQRRLLTDALRPPEGYTLDEAIGCTYSLDLIALAGVPLACMSLDPTLLKADEAGSTIAALECVRRHAERFTVFCQAGAMHVPREHRDVFLWLERSVVEVTAPTVRGVFHPKLWFLRYTAPQGSSHESAHEPDRYRVVVLSRNLTYDRSWDVVTAIEGARTERQNAIGENKDLVDFVRALGTEIAPVRPMAQAHAQRVERFAHEIGRVRFEAPAGAQTWQFWPIGIRGHRYKVHSLFRQQARSPFSSLTQNAHRAGRRMLVVAPFVTPGVVASLATSRVAGQLVSSEVMLDDMHDALPISWLEALPRRVHGFVDPAGDTGKPLSGLHAKLWVADDGHDAHMWMGSANATDAAFERNVECLLQVTGPRSTFGIDALLGDPDERGFRDFLMPYAPPDAVDEAGQAERRRERELGLLLQQLAASGGLTAAVEEGEDGYVLTLDLPAALPQATTLAAWPVTLSPTAANQARDTARQGFAYRGLELNQLTEFWCLALTQEGTVVQGVTQVAPTGMPDHGQRSTAVLARHLKDISSLSLYLEFLLAGRPGELASRLRERRRRRAASVQGADVAQPLFETLLGALASDRGALADVDALLETTAGGASALAVHAEFVQLWAAVREARNRLEAGA